MREFIFSLVLSEEKMRGRYLNACVSEGEGEERKGEEEKERRRRTGGEGEGEGEGRIINAGLQTPVFKCRKPTKPFLV